MVRFTNPKSVPPLEDVEIPLLCGPPKDDGWPPETMAEMEAGWRAYGDQIMANCADRDWTPWGFEAFGPP